MSTCPPCSDPGKGDNGARYRSGPGGIRKRSGSQHAGRVAPGARSIYGERACERLPPPSAVKESANLVRGQHDDAGRTLVDLAENGIGPIATASRPAVAQPSAQSHHRSATRMIAATTCAWSLTSLQSRQDKGMRKRLLYNSNT